MVGTCTAHKSLVLCVWIQITEEVVCAHVDRNIVLMNHFSSILEFNLTQKCVVVSMGVNLPSHVGFCSTYNFKGDVLRSLWMNSMGQVKINVDTSFP